jgi:hypothetical protein
MTDNNPLRQYFRRPALYLKLPSGGAGYPAGSLDLPDNGELPIYPMTAIDEITCRTPDALYNGSAVVEVIRSCVPNIKDPWAVTNVDLDPLLVAIKIATNGAKTEIDTQCPSCGENAKYDIELPRILAGFKAADYETPLPIGDLKIKFRPLNYTELNRANEAQFQAQRMLVEINNTENDDDRNRKTSEALVGMNMLAVEIITYTIEAIITPEITVSDNEFIKEYLLNCDSATFDKIKDKNTELRRASETKPMRFKCVDCQHEYEQPFTVNMTDFFG